MTICLPRKTRERLTGFLMRWVQRGVLKAVDGARPVDWGQAYGRQNGILSAGNRSTMKAAGCDLDAFESC